MMEKNMGWEEKFESNGFAFSRKRSLRSPRNFAFANKNSIRTTFVFPPIHSQNICIRS